MYKEVSNNIPLRFKPAFPGLKGIDIFARQYPIEPFLVITEFYMSQAVFGPHPHAGISVMTYLLPDSKAGFVNRDSNGDHSRIEPGGLHITQAGSGIHHDEFPERSGVETHGFQIWINHSEANRMAEPKAIHANANEVLKVVDDNMTIRILHGAYKDFSTKYQMMTPVNLYHATLHANRSVEFDAEEMTFLYVIEGDGSVSKKKIGKNSLVLMSEGGNRVQIKSGDQTLDFLFASAKPINEPIVYGGPFVMTTEEQMRIAKLNYGQGKMGFLEPYS